MLLAMELLIVGGGLAAQRCIEVLRAAGDDRPVTVVCDEPVRPYDRPPLSKEGLLGGIDPAFRPEEWYREHAVELRLGAAALALDPARRRVTLDGGEQLGYDALLIATGARARALPGVPRAQVLRSRFDGERLRVALLDGGPLAVVGAGLIGLEAAAAAHALGVDVCVIEAAPRPLAGVLGPRAGAWLTALHRAEGVVLRTGVTARRDLGGALELSDGTRVGAAHVLAGVGGEPAVDWLAGSGLGPGAVAVDASGRTGLPGVYAAGDVTGAGHWEAAARGGTAAGRALLGRSPLSAAPPSFWSDQHGVRLQCVGDPRGAREVLAHGDLASREFELDHLHEGRVTAVLLAGRPPSALRGRTRTADHARIPKESRMSLIARIEDDLCLAHGDCEAVAPEAFRVADVARVVGETTDDRLRAAARACPAGAIVLYDAETGEEVDA
jgi:3-phenylpropionate/trans-cinnamate dioxygenase ferredoxin reductase subunit